MKALLFLILLIPIDQKLKFKNIYPLVVDKDYASAEPMLERFLELEPEHPAANLNMMIVADEYLKDGDLVIKYAELSTKLVTEKDIKKNMDFYKYYERRDMRSGDYTVKLSDIQLDIERRTQKYQDN